MHVCLVALDSHVLISACSDTTLVHMHACTCVYLSISLEVCCVNSTIKTHGSESRGQEEAGLRNEQVSYLQVAPL